MNTVQFKAHLEHCGFRFQADGVRLFVDPRAELTPDEVARIKAEKDDLLWLLLPCLVPDSDGLALLVPRGADKRNQYWRDGSRTLWDLLAELNAPAATVRRYTELADDGLHTALAVRECKGRVVELAELRYCPDCGYRSA